MKKYLNSILKKLAEIEVNHPLKLLIAVFLFSLLMLPGIIMVKLDSNMENFLPENDSEVLAMSKIFEDFEGTSSMTFLIMIDNTKSTEINDIREPEILKKTEQLSSYLLDNDYITSISSPITLIKQQNNGIIPNNINTIQKIISNNPQIKESFSSDYKILKISASMKEITNIEENDKAYSEIKEIMHSVQFPEGVVVKDWGSLSQSQELEASMGDNMSLTSILGFVLIFIIIFIFYRSITTCFLVILPILFSLIWLVGTMGYIDLPFTFVSTSVISLVIGLGVDYNIHLIHHIRHHIKNGASIEHSLEKTIEEIGSAIFSSGLTTAFGFLALVLGSLLVFQRLGITLAISIIYVFISSLLITPTFILLLDKMKEKLTFFGGVKK